MPQPVVLPYPPTGNLYWRHWRGRVVTSPVAKRYRSAAAMTALASGLRPVEEGDVLLWLVFYRPRRMGDLDNSLKVTLDALRGVAYRDDSQVAELHARRREDKAQPRVEVWVNARPE